MIRLEFSREEIRSLASVRIANLSEGVKAKEEKISDIESQLSDKSKRKDEDWKESMEKTVFDLKEKIKRLKEDIIRIKIYADYAAPIMHNLTIVDLEDSGLIAKKGFVK